MNKIRICIVLPSHWSRTMGGAEYQVSLIIGELIASGNYEIHYLCRNALFDRNEYGYQLHSIGSRSRLSKYAKFTDSKLLLRKLIAIDPDIVYHRNGGAYTGVCAYYAKTRHKKFFWHLAHEKDVVPDSLFAYSNPLKYIDKLMLDYGIRNAKKIIAQTEEQSLLLQAHFGRTADITIKNFHPIPDIVAKKPSKQITVLWVANFNIYKQPQLCLELAKRLESKSDVKFLMVGRAPDSYSALVQLLRGQSNIDYRGPLTIDQVNNLFNESDIFINTSSQEGFPNSFIQAWMREVPVVSLTVNPDKVLHSASIGICSGSLPQMEQDLLRLIRNDSERLEMGHRAREYAIKHHSPENIRVLLDLFEAAVS